jgi:SET domain-containing protein
MMNKTLVKNLVGKGRGIVAVKRIVKGSLIESCPVALFSVPLGSTHILETYAFRWSKNKVAIALGNGSLYNHSYTPNAEYTKDIKNKVLLVYALRTILPGEEICFNYNGHPDNKAPLWFKVK